MAVISVLVADDHSIIRYGLCSILNSVDDVQVVAEASSGSEAIALYDKHRPRISILDITMPDQDGIETCEAIRKINPEALVIIMTMHLNEEYLNKVLAAGAAGYMLKNSSKSEIISNIRRVIDGGRVFSKAVSDLMTESYIRQRRDEMSPSGSGRNDVHLTKREKEILEMIVQGNTNHAIAKVLFISPRTVETHRANLMHKLDVNNTAALVRQAVENKLI